MSERIEQRSQQALVRCPESICTGRCVRLPCNFSIAGTAEEKDGPSGENMRSCRRILIYEDDQFRFT